MQLPLKWHGGKGAFDGALAKWIIGLMPEHTHYVEVFAGGLSVLLHKNPENVSEVVNDIHGELTAFWRVLRDPDLFGILKRRVEATPLSEVEWVSADGSGTDVDRAVSFFIRCRQSRQGMMNCFATMSRNRTRRGMNEQAAGWLSAIEGLDEVHARMRRVVVLCRDFREVIRTQDGENTVFYLDPSYLHSERKTTDAYEHEMSVDDHAELLDLLAGVKGKFLLSGYHSDLYDEVAAIRGWECHEYKIVNNAAGGKKKEVRTECVWCNFVKDGGNGD